MCSSEVWFISIMGDWLVPKNWERSLLQCPCPWLSPVLLLSDWSLKIFRCLWNWAPEYSNTSVCYPEYLILFLMGCKHLTSRNLKCGVTDSVSLVGFSAWNQNSNSASEMKGDGNVLSTIAYCGWILKNILILSIATNILGLIPAYLNFSISI